MNLIRFEFGLMISIWFCYVYVFDMVLDVILIWFDMVWERSAFWQGS